MNRTSLVAGPAKIEFNGATFFNYDAFNVDLGYETFDIAPDAFGLIDRRANEVTCKTSIKPEGRWNAAHHPFTSPHEQDMDKLMSDPGAVRALAYDVVLNGTELGSGSIRIHRQDIQKQIFRGLGMTDEEAKSRFGFFLEALEYGTPPHGGIALGLDRIVMILAGADSLREVIPFPKTAKAVDLMVDAPTPVSEAQLKELGIKIR